MFLRYIKEGLLVAGILLAGPMAVSGNGTVNFSNISSEFQARMTYENEPLQGSDWVVQLYVGNDESTLAPVNAPIHFREGAPGFFLGGIVEIPGFGVGSTVPAAQVKAWNITSGMTYELADARTESNVFSIENLGGGINLPANLSGMRTASTTPVPTVSPGGPPPVTEEPISPNPVEPPPDSLVGIVEPSLEEPGPGEVILLPPSIRGEITFQPWPIPIDGSIQIRMSPIWRNPNANVVFAPDGGIFLGQTISQGELTTFPLIDPWQPGENHVLFASGNGQISADLLGQVEPSSFAVALSSAAMSQSFSAVPEPGTALLSLLALTGIVFGCSWRARRR